VLFATAKQTVDGSARPAVGSYAENQKISAIRKVFLRGIGTPLLNIEVFWGEYCVFEKVRYLRARAFV